MPCIDAALRLLVSIKPEVTIQLEHIHINYINEIDYCHDDMESVLLSLVLAPGPCDSDGSTLKSFDFKLQLQIHDIQFFGVWNPTPG